MKNSTMIAIDNAHYREAAEYDTTVASAIKAAGMVEPTDCLAYEVRQYLAVYAKQLHNIGNDGLEHLTISHPDYAPRLAERQKKAEQQLEQAYKLREQELIAELGAVRSINPPDKRLQLARLLKESANQLFDGYAGYLAWVGDGRVLPGWVSPIGRISNSYHPEDAATRSRFIKERAENSKVCYGYTYDAGSYKGLDRGLVVAAAGAADLAHFRRLLAEFHQAEQAPTQMGQADIEEVEVGTVTNSCWDGVLINYTLSDLNTLLRFVGLLETIEPLTLADDTKAGQWVAVAAALKKAKRTMADRAVLYRAFSKTYGPAVGSLSSFQRPYNEANAMANACYTRALARLGQS